MAFVSPSRPGVEVTLNRVGHALPPGFAVELASEDDVAELAGRAPAAGVRVVEPLADAQFSVLDPAGRRITVHVAREGWDAAVDGDPMRRITRAMPSTTVADLAVAAPFYVGWLGFEVHAEWPDVILFQSPSSARAEVLAGVRLTSPDAFCLDVGTIERVEAVHAAAVGHAVIMGGPQDFTEKSLRGFMVVDPNGVAIDVLAPTGRRPEG